VSEKRVQRLDDLRGDAVPEDPVAFLQRLGRPSWIRVRGRDRSRLRVVTTLLHGNEPSGLRAMHGWLRTGVPPAVDAWLLVASVGAALAPPGFAYRSLPGRADLNRCFLGPFEGEEGALAREILDVILAARPESLIDVHNNTGHNPPYAVSPRAGAAELQLGALFGERLVQNRLRLGALVEATADLFPSIVVEVGRAGDPAADAVARAGLDRFLGDAEVIRPATGPPPLQILVDPFQVRARPEIRLAFGDGPDPGADLTVLADIDRHNFEVLGPGVPIGWVRPGAPWPLEARAADGSDVSEAYFALCDGRLQTRRGIVPMMMTTDVGIARSDCLFYAVRPDDRAAPGH
jgi:hypothetical protein